MKTSIFTLCRIGIIASLFLAGCSKDPAVSTKKDFRLNEEIHLAPMMEKQPGGKYIDGAYIVVLNDDVKETEVDRESDRICNQRKSKKNRSFKYALKGFAVNLSAVEIEEVRKDPRVKYIEQDQVVTTVATQTSATWGLDRLDQPALPLNQSYTYNNNGSTVDAYIFDTGIKLDHVEFTGRVSTGYNSVTVGASPNDGNGHGTHVAGTVGGTIYGVAKQVKLIPVKVLGDNGSGTNAGVVAGIDWAVGNHLVDKPAVGNMSLGGGASQATDDAVRRAISDGIVMCVAAGNSNLDASTSSPARTPEAITVGSTTSTDARSSFSNFGSVVDIFAPGSSITSAWFTSSTATNTISGTSMACPHVAGVAALYLENKLGTTTAQIEAALKNNAATGLITGLPAGTANRLLQSSFTPPPAVPLLLIPAIGATGVSRTPTLSWSPAADATSYNVQYSTTTGFTPATTVIKNVTIGTSFPIATALLSRTKYYWRVQSVRGTVTSAYSASRSFTTIR
jgi:aqualysin 1